MSKMTLMHQYENKFIPEMTCICLRFCSLSDMIYPTIVAGKITKPIANTNRRDATDVLRSASLYFCRTG